METSPQSVFVADVNGDGRADLVTANTTSDSVSVLLGAGGGAFATRTNYSVGRAPSFVAVADLNEDGRADLITSANSQSVSVLLGLSSGGFGTRTDYATSPNLDAVAVIDVDGDGHRDVVTANFYGFNVNVLLGDGSGSLAAKKTFPAGGLPRTLAVGDLNGDARPDLLTAGYDSGSVTLLTNAGGTFTGDTFNISLPALTLLDTSITEGSGGLALATFTIQLSNASLRPVTVDYATADGTAFAPGDYLAIPHASLIFEPGETTSKIFVNVRSDTLYEGGATETFQVLLSNPVNATLARAQAVGSILPDDLAPTQTTVLDSGHAFTFFDANHDKVTVKLTGLGTGTIILDNRALTGADLSEIVLTGTTSKSALSLSLKKDASTGDGRVGLGEVTVTGALGSFKAPAIDLDGGGFRASGAVKSLNFHSLVSGEIFTGGTVADALTVTAGSLGEDIFTFRLATAQTLSALQAGSIASGQIEAAAVKSLAVSAGSMAADLTSAGAIAKITVKGGGLSGQLQAASFGAISITGGDFSGSLTSLTPAATLGATKALASLTITGGDLTGDIRLLGTSGAVSVAKKGSAGGNVGGASITARGLDSLTVGGNVISSVVLAGADLGADHAFGGDDDHFAAGNLGAVKIGGNVIGAGSIIGAGFSTGNDVLKDEDDTVVGGMASVIASLTIAGTAAPESYFVAGAFAKPPKIAGVVVSPATDARFKLG